MCAMIDRTSTKSGSSGLGAISSDLLLVVADELGYGESEHALRRPTGRATRRQESGVAKVLLADFHCLRAVLGGILSGPDAGAVDGKDEGS